MQLDNFTASEYVNQGDFMLTDAPEVRKSVQELVAKLTADLVHAGAWTTRKVCSGETQIQYSESYLDSNEEIEAGDLHHLAREVAS